MARDRSLPLAAVMALIAAPTFAQSGGDYRITSSVMASGGASHMTGGEYSVGGTLGQNTTGVSTDLSNLYRLTHGFWRPVSDNPAAPNGIIWDPMLNPIPWPNNNPLATTRSLRFMVAGEAGPSKPEAIKVTMTNLQDPVPPNLPANPPPNFTGYESGTCAPMECVGGVRDGLTCMVTDDCKRCSGGTNPGVPCPVGNECLGGGTCPATTCTAVTESNGCARWVGKLETFLESQDSGVGGGTYRAARLQCTPYYWDWKPEGLIGVYGAEIAPSSEYRVEVYGASCMGAETGCTAVSLPVTMYTRRSGDVEVPFNPPSTTGQPDVTDIAQLVNKFKNVAGAPVKAITQLQPNLPELNADINALDIVAVVDGVKQLAYSFSGPCPCPSTVPCTATSCTSATICGTTYGVGSTCVKTCSGGANDGDTCINVSHCPGGACGAGFCRDRCGRCTP